MEGKFDLLNITLTKKENKIVGSVLYVDSKLLSEETIKVQLFVLDI